MWAQPLYGAAGARRPMGKFSSGYRMANGRMACQVIPPLGPYPDIEPSGVLVMHLLARAGVQCDQPDYKEMLKRRKRAADGAGADFL